MLFLGFITRVCFHHLLVKFIDFLRRIRAVECHARGCFHGSHFEILNYKSHYALMVTVSECSILGQGAKSSYRSKCGFTLAASILRRSSGEGGEAVMATVAGVFFDVDGDQHVAVTLNDDPAADLHQAHGRFLYFHPDEVEPVR